jgi:hypothetical protein
MVAEDDDARQVVSIKVLLKAARDAREIPVAALRHQIR